MFGDDEEGNDCKDSAQDYGEFFPFHGLRSIPPVKLQVTVRNIIAIMMGFILF
jgi:hypothetical protein